jgi:cobalamin biosynthesis protein CbiG
VGTISANHGHSGAVITAAQLASPTGVSLDIRGSADHPHTVILTAADVTAIAGGQRVSKESSTDSAHSHTVTFN